MEKYTIYKIIFILSFLSIFANSKAQENTPFVHYMAFQKLDSSKLFLRLENFNFVKNNEYDGNFTNGATYMGYLASPKLVYYPSSRIRLEIGARLQKYSGRENFTKTEPILTANYHASDQLDIILGALNQDNNHDLSRVLYEPERFFTDKAENGFQILYSSKRLQLDTWINWEQFILENDPFQERFTFGVSSEIRINQLSSPYKISIPAKILFTHRGGEIDSSNGTVQTIGHFSSGLKLARKIENSRFTSWSLKAIAYYFIDNSSRKEFLFDDGHALYPQANITTKYSSLSIGYWNAYHFAASRGFELFQSSSYAKPGYFESRRELATLNYYYEKRISKGIYFGGKLDLYYDLRNSKESYSTAIYLRINGDFFLKKVKWN
ncbi:hypothetical protein [Ancylomarina longa]|uniref:Uncharacterized protein n=1 Tax=Ancylomarina longa TaxID=2487017 RepID=A0A434AV62_9BACT|nr:hypothetical protein [Ancylomarina longa]RUT78361.1 hypothetical protein DLK05_08525 [Ancylomarina longa]